MLDIKKLVQPYVDNTNANGHSAILQPKIEDDGSLNYDTEYLRIYVPEKFKLNQLPDRMMLPASLEDIPVNVVPVGWIVAGGPPPTNPMTTDPRRDVVRPLVSGISVGNWSITAGTQGVPAVKEGVEYWMSNAHVLSEDPSLDWSNEKRTVQPGKHDDGVVPQDIVGLYSWHTKIYPKGGIPTGCNVAKTWGAIGNFFATIMKRKSRLSAIVELDNHVDQAGYIPADGVSFDITKTFDFDISGYDLVGRIFAGSTLVSIHHKLKYQIDAGYIPVVPYKLMPNLTKDVRKSGRTTGDTTGDVMDMAGVIDVNYGNFTAKFTDVVFSSKMVEGGDSGSDLWQTVD